MTTEEMRDGDLQAGRCVRLGRSPFWLHIEREAFGPAGCTALRATVTYKPPRRRKVGMGSPLIDLSARHPLFSLRARGETFPLIPTECEIAARGFNVVMCGSRKVYLDSLHVIDFSIRLKPVSGQAGTQISMQFKCSVTPPLPKSITGDLEIEISAPMQHSEPWWFPYAPLSHRPSALLWNQADGVGVSYVLPDAAPAKRAEPVVGVPRESGVRLTHMVPRCVKRASGSYKFSIRFDQARLREHAQMLHLRHTHRLLSPALPDTRALTPLSLRERAAGALARITDKSGYHAVGIERVYYRPGDTQSGAQFCAGFPHFPLDAARAMLDWDNLMGDEQAARLAILIARGIGTDFSVIMPDAYGQCVNKGAFWDRRRSPTPGSENVFSDYLGDDFHSIASTARIATGLFRVYQLTGDPISQNAGIAACQWLLLKQNEFGYFDGDRVDGSSGAIVHEAGTLAGIEVIHALVHAYYVSGNEVYIKAAHRVERYIVAELMPKFVASPIFRTSHVISDDSAASVASLVKALATLRALLHTHRSAEELEMAGIWLRSWDLSDPSRMSAINQDGHYDGLYEIARAALAVLAEDHNPGWLQMALSIGAALPQEAWSGWQSIPLFIETMLGLVCLVKNASVNLQHIQAKASWSDFAPDSSTYKYINVVAAQDGGAESIPVDFLPLVSRGDGRVLLPVLAHGSVGKVQVFQNGRLPNLRDLVANEIVCQPAPLHKLPFSGPWRWGCFTIDP